MNIATGKLDAPVEKQASILDAITEAGTALAKYRGAGGEAIPYALSAGMGAGAQQATNRMLRSKLINRPKLLKALELGSATALGGGAGLAGALAAPLSKSITRSSAGSAARQIGELTAMGAGAELAINPALSGLLGAPVGATEALGKMFGGGALALGGQVAKDRRLLSVLRNHYAMGGKLPRGVDPRVLGLTTRQNITQRFNSLGIPGGGLLGASGLGLMASGNPYLGAGALLAAPLKNKKTSKYIGDVIRELRAGASKAKVDQKTKNTIDGLYKKSSHTIKLAAPVYQTHYCLDAPTMDKVAFMTRAFKGLAKGLTNNSFFAEPGSGALMQSARGFTRGLAQDIGAGFKRVTTPFTRDGAIMRGSDKATRVAKSQGATTEQAAAVGEQALLRERRIGVVDQAAAKANPDAAAQAAELTPMSYEVAPLDPNAGSFRRIGDYLTRPFREGYQQARQSQLSPIVKTEQGAQELSQLGSRMPKNRGDAGRAMENIEGATSGSGRTAPELAQQATTVPTAPVPTHSYRGTGGQVPINSQAIEQVEALGNINNSAVNARFTPLHQQVEAAVGGGASRADAIAALSAEDRAFYQLVRPYANTVNGQVKLRSDAGANLREAVNQSRAKLTGAQNVQQANTQAVANNPLVAPVNAPAAPPSRLSAPTQASSELQAAEQAQQLTGALGEAQSAAAMRVRAPGKGLLTDTQQGAEIAELRFGNSELGQQLAAIEGGGGLAGNPITRNIKGVREKAIKDAQLHTAAAENAKATEVLNAEVANHLTDASHRPQVQQILRDLGKQSDDVNPEAVVSALESRLGTTLTQADKTRVTTEVTSLLNTQAGRNFSRTQQQLNVRMGQYEREIARQLESRLVQVERSSSKRLAKTVNKLNKEKSGVIPTGRRQRARSTQEIQNINDIQALAESRARILRDSSIQGGGTLAARTQAAELMRITEEALRTGTAEDLINLRQVLANPTAKITSRGKASKVHKLLDTTARNKVFTLNNQQETAFRKVVQMEGRGAGNQVEEVRKIFTASAARSPETPQGRELTRVLTEAETAQGAGQNIANLGKQDGAGQSAFTKLTGGDAANYQAQNYTVAELEAMAGTTGPVNFRYGNAPGQPIFEEFIIRGNGTIRQNAKVLDQQITKLENKLRELRAGPKSPQGQKIADDIAKHKAARAQVDRYAQAQQQHLNDTFQTARGAQTRAQEIVQSDLSMSNITLLNDVAKVQQPRGLDLDGARKALEEAATSDPAQHRSMASNIFNQIKAENPAMADEAIAGWMVREGKLLTDKQLVSMGGAQAFASGTAQQAGGGALAGVATVGAAGLGTAALAGRKPGPATQAQQQAQQQVQQQVQQVVQSSWGLSPLAAPVIRSKLASPIKPIPLKATQPKLPNPKNIPAQSLLTATVEGQEQAMKMSSLLAAPVGGRYYGHV